MKVYVAIKGSDVIVYGRLDVQQFNELITCGYTVTLTRILQENTMPKFCKDYTYFHIGVALGDIVGSLVLTFHFGFWSVEVVLRDMPERKR